MPEKKICDRTYKAEKMPARLATRNLIRLSKIIGPALPRLAAAISAEGKADADVLPAVSDLLMASSADELTDFMVEIAETAQVKDKGSSSYDDVIYDMHLVDIIEAFQVVAFVLQVNYRDFFGAKLGGLLKTGPAAA